jgi:ribosomal protein S14
VTIRYEGGNKEVLGASLSEGLIEPPRLVLRLLFSREGDPRFHFDITHRDKRTGDASGGSQRCQTDGPALGILRRVTRVPRYEIREVAGGWAMISTWPPAVSASTPPPADMPPVDLMVLESLRDGDETIYTMRDCGEMAASGLPLVGEEHILRALRDLLRSGLITVTGELRRTARGGFAEEPVPTPGTDDASLRRYWFALTAEGDAVLRGAEDILDMYYGRLNP